MTEERKLLRRLTNKPAIFSDVDPMSISKHPGVVPVSQINLHVGGVVVVTT